ncbi:MAG TPA: DUF6130 family protein [Allosphingosinicella sp.]|jgi:hypothetical protein
MASNSGFSSGNGGIDCRNRPSPLVSFPDEPPARLVVDPPLPGPLAKGRVFIEYRTENLRVLPVFGEAAMHVSPRVGHVHVTVDDGPWHFVDASGQTIVIVGLSAGEHRVLVELADPIHGVMDRQVVSFRVPTEASAHLPEDISQRKG